MDKISLKAEKREYLGKKSRKLRRLGVLPANLFGKGIQSVSIKINQNDFLNAFKQAKTTHVVYLKLDKEELPVLIQNAQKHPISREILHADFRKIDLKEKVETEVPVVVVGELEVVKSGEADIITLRDHLLVEALPTNIPDKIVVDISKLGGIGAEVRVKDLPKGKDYEFIEDEDASVVQIAEAKKEEIVAPPPAEEAEAAAEGAPAEAGEAAPEEKATEEKKEE